MPPYDFHRRVIWILWCIVFGIGMVIFALVSHAQTGYMDQGKKRWGQEDWSLIMQFYYPHDHKHGTWFNNYGKNCCSNTDCFPARENTVKWTPDGYRIIMPDGGYAMIPEDAVVDEVSKKPAIKPNPDDVGDLRPTICLRKLPQALTEYGGATYHGTVWRIREGCAWYGRPRL